jgi:colanic acid/amylovoran biosynthesis glycosyltransferase
MQKIRVAHVLHTFLPITENWIFNQLHHNDACDHLVISQFRKNESLFPVKVLYSACPGGFVQKIFKQISRTKIWPRQSFYNSIICKEKPHIIHGHFSTESCRVLNVASRHKIPLVTTFYGLDVNKLPRRKYWKRKYASLFKTGAAFIVEGHHMANRLAEIGCDPQKISIIHIGVDIERIRKKINSIRTDRSVFRVLFIGLEREKKGAMDAARAFCGLLGSYPDAELHIVGEGKYRKPVEQLFKDNGYISRVIFHGIINVDRYHELLALCDVVLAPSCTAADGDTEGGAPVVCIEAQAAEKVVISTNHCDIPEIVLHEKCGLLCNEHDIDQLTRNLLLMAQNPQLRIQMGQQGYEHVQKNHSIKKQVTQITSIYHSLIENKNG